MSASGPGDAPLLTETGIQWGNLLRTVFGGAILAWFSGIVSIILGIADIPIALIAGLGNFLGEVVTVMVRLPAVIIRSGFSAAVPFVLGSGLAGFAVAVGIVLLTVFVASEVLTSVRQ